MYWPSPLAAMPTRSLCGCVKPLKGGYASLRRDKHLHAYANLRTAPTKLPTRSLCGIREIPPRILSESQKKTLLRWHGWDGMCFLAKRSNLIQHQMRGGKNSQPSSEPQGLRPLLRVGTDPIWLLVNLLPTHLNEFSPNSLRIFGPLEIHGRDIHFAPLGEPLPETINSCLDRQLLF